MIQPKGFGKKYFTLAAIQAYSAHAVLQSLTSKTESHCLLFAQDDDVQEDLEEELLEQTPLLAVSLQSLSHECCCHSVKIKTPSLKQFSNNTFSLQFSNAPPLHNASAYLFTCKKLKSGIPYES